MIRKNLIKVLCFFAFTQIIFAVTRQDLLDHAREAIKTDAAVVAAKAKFPIIFKHPSYVEHLEHLRYQSLRYHEVYVRTLRAGVQEWEVFGAGVDMHYAVVRKIWSFSKRLLLWKNNLSFAALKSEDTIPALLTKELKLVALIPAGDYSVKHKLLVMDGVATPIYWVEIKARALNHTTDRNENRASRFGRVVVFNALTSKTLYNYSKHHGIEALSPIVIRDGRARTATSKKSASDDPTADLIQQFKENCQVISQNSKSFGQPILVNPDKCDLIFKDETLQEHMTADDSATRALDNSKKILNYYLTNFDQYGFDNDKTKKTTITSVVHVGDSFDNAYWDSDLSVMVYGDGTGGNDKNATNDYTLARDVAGHEFTHAIVSSTANFMEPGEAGALNEAFADIFGILMERSYVPNKNWNIGSALYINQPGGDNELALRSLSNPGKFTTSVQINGIDKDLPFPDKYSNLLDKGLPCTDDNDQCDVHGNSTIWSHNAFLADSALQAQGLDAQTADKITGEVFFAALTHRLHENSTMKESATEVLAACTDLFADGKCDAFKAAFKQTELIDAQ